MITTIIKSFGLKHHLFVLLLLQLTTFTITSDLQLRYINCPVALTQHHILMSVDFTFNPLLNKFYFNYQQRIKKLEEESNYQLLKPLPEHVKITGDSKVSLLNIESGCTLKSNVEQVSCVELFCMSFFKFKYSRIKCSLSRPRLSVRRIDHKA